VSLRSFYAVDPGVDYFAWAFVDQIAQIVLCGLYRGRPRDFFENAGGAVVIEDQRILPGVKARHADIINLAQSAGAIESHFDNVTWAPLLQFPKPKRGCQSIPEQRCRKYMTPAELALFETHGKGELEHLWDAGYFALKYSGRIT
jgi:hypothetical protein